MHKSLKRNDTAQYHSVGWHWRAVVTPGVLAELCGAADERLRELLSECLMVGRRRCDSIQVLDRRAQIGDRPHQCCCWDSADPAVFSISEHPNPDADTFRQCFASDALLLAQRAGIGADARRPDILTQDCGVSCP